MADAGSESGSIGESENEMIQNIFEFDDITVGEIATHRTEMTVLWAEDSDSVWEETVKNDIHSYYPICGDTIDTVTGILDAKKYLRLSDRSRASVMAHAVGKPRYVTEVMKADALFREMKRGRFTVAIVVDEYGGTSGIVTLNDLIEQIVGDLDESENAGDIRKQGAGYIISGLAERESFDELFGIDTGNDSATVGGWVMEQLEKIPEAGDELERDGFIYRVPGKGCYVAEKNVELVREEHLKRIEQHMREIVALAVPCGMDEAETARMLELIWSEEENSDERN